VQTKVSQYGAKVKLRTKTVICRARRKSCQKAPKSDFIMPTGSH
jgi:hypothetical protein